MRLFLSIVVIRSVLLKYVDYIATYLNAVSNDRTVFIRQPIGFQNIGLNCERLVCLVL